MYEWIKNLTPNRKLQLTELLYLIILLVVIPLSVGLQIFDQFSFALSLVLVNVFLFPSVIFLYRWVFPRTVFNGKGWWFIPAIILFVFLFEINNRLSYLIMLDLPFIPQGYKDKLASAHAEILGPRLIQNIDYTLLIILSSFGFLFIRELFKRQHTVEQLKSDKLQLELGQLKSQIQPHFFFNTLNNLYSLSLQGSPKTSVSIANLSEIMRYVLYEAMQERVLLAKEIAFTQSYLDLERIRHTDQDVITFNVQGNPSGILIEPLLFLPLIENCFKHSLQRRLAGNQIQMVLNIEEKELTFQTSNLLAPPDGVLRKEGGIGLQNVRKRLNLLYPGKHQFYTNTENGKFVATLSLQLS